MYIYRVLYSIWICTDMKNCIYATNVWAMSTTTDGNLRSSGTFQLETWMNDLGSIEPQYQSPNPSETIMV